MNVVDRAREIAIHEFVPAADYITESTGDFDRAQYFHDLALSRSICNDRGYIEIPNVITIAAFVIDDNTIIVRIEDPMVVTVEIRGI